MEDRLALRDRLEACSTWAWLECPPMPKRGLLFAVVVLVALVAFSEHLAFNRIFQVDELENVFTARLLATGQLSNYAETASLMHMGPMGWIAGNIDRSALLLRAERLLFFGLFWLNLFLIVRCAGVRLRSNEGLIALLLVVTLAPLWDYGFEIRHETPLLTAILIAWNVARPLDPDRKRRLFIVGLVGGLAQFVAFKAFAYMIPIALFALVAAKLEDKRPLWRVIAALVAGTASGVVVALFLQWSAGTWAIYAKGIKGLTGVVVRTERFSALPTLSRLLVQTPVLLLVGVFASLYALRHARAHSITSRDSLLPELALLAGAIVAILANPTPFPYNVVLLVPQAAILCLRLLPRVPSWSSNRAWKATLAILVLLHAVFWFLATRRHLAMSNARQIDLMTTAEEMTDPRRHRVFDGAGLVPTRYPPGRFWLIHTFTIAAFRNGSLPSIRSQLAEGRTPVVIPNYRVSALPAEDHRFIGEHYVALAGDFLVAGTVLGRTQKTEWDCLVAGRYYLELDPHQGRAVIDGRPVGAGVLVLDRGRHTFEAGAPGGSYLVWLGPKLDAPPALIPGDSRAVLVNWY